MHDRGGEVDEVEAGNSQQIDDPTSDYARVVLSSEIVAGDLVRNLARFGPPTSHFGDVLKVVEI